MSVPHTNTKLKPFLGALTGTAALMDLKGKEVVDWMGFDGARAKGALSKWKRLENCRRLAACWNAFHDVPVEDIETQGSAIVKAGLEALEKE